MHSSTPRYALLPLGFPYRQLATLAGRAPIGGAREVALACFLTARLAGDRLADSLPEGAHAARGAGARGWLSSLALPAPVRGPIAQCVELATAGTVAELGAALALLGEAAAPYLETGARAELEHLAARLTNAA